MYFIYYEFLNSIIVIIYFENVTFFHAKLRSDVCPRVDNQTSGDTLQVNSTTSGKITMASVIHPWVLEPVFSGGMPFLTPSSSD